jgi:hypothetical protein
LSRPPHSSAAPRLSAWVPGAAPRSRNPRGRRRRRPRRARRTWCR